MNTVDFSYEIALKNFSTRLFKHTNVSHFKHTRVYQNEKNIVFISNPNDSSQSVFNDNPVINSNKNNVGMKIYLKMEQCFSLITKHDNYIDIFDFVGSQDHHKQLTHKENYQSFIQTFIESYLTIFNNALTNEKKGIAAASTSLKDEKMDNTNDDPKNIFTKRELDCLKLLIAGNTAKMTAKKLKISHRTVERFFDNIKDKLGVRRKTEIISKVINFVNID